MKFVTKRLLILLCAYLALFSDFLSSKISKIKNKQNLPCDGHKSGSSITLRDFPLKVQLTWGGTIKDLDLTVRRKDGQSVSSQKKSNFDGNIHFLSKDARGGSEKKEAVEIKKINSGKFLILVNNFSRDGHIGTSKAKIRFFHGADQVLEVKVPKSDNNPSSLNWIVGLVEFNQGKAIFKLVNKLSLLNQINNFFELPDEDGGNEPAPGQPRRVNPRPSPRVKSNPSVAKNYIDIKDFPIKLELNWKAPNKDLDFYIRRSDRQQVNYSKKVNFDGKIKLIKDDRGTNRHETILIEKIPSGKFLIFVNNFSKDAHLSKSSAEVKIMHNGRQIISVKIPTNDTNRRNLNWVVGMLVFDRNGAKFITQNSFTTANGPMSFFNTIKIKEGSSPARRVSKANRAPSISNKAGYDIKNKDMKVELLWSAPNKDLDFYFRRADGQQVNFAKKSNFDNKVELVKDDRGTNRREQINFLKLNSGKFILFVNNYSKDAHLSRSRANVKIYVGGQVKQTVNIPSNDNNPRNLNWVVGLFDFGTGKFTAINKLTTDLNSVNNFFRS